MSSIGTRNQHTRMMEFSNTFSPLVPTNAVNKNESVQCEDEVKEEANLESYSKHPLWAAFRKGTSGWKAGLMICITADAVVFIIILVFTLTSAFAFPRSDSQVTLIDGSCSKTKSYSIWLHLLINVLSTILLASSSYAMQCVISPTKNDLARAHLKGSYMTIGAPSLRNLSHVPRYRAFLYVVATISSLPIHLLANSAIFQTLGTDSYVMAVAYQQFIQIPSASLRGGYGYRMSSFHSGRQFHAASAVGGRPSQGGSPDEDVYSNVDVGIALKAMLPNMTRLENDECIRTYSQQLLAGWRHVIAVSEDAPPPNTNSSNYNYIAQVYYQSVNVCPTCQTYLNYTDPTIWTCDFMEKANNKLVRSCDSSKAVPQAKDFSIEARRISYCMAEPVPEKCRLQTDLGMLGVLLGVTFMKMCILLAVALKLPGGIIATLGDAIAIYLKDPDSSTRGCCLLDRRDVQQRQQKKTHAQSQPYHFENLRWRAGMPFHKQWTSSSLNRRWGSGPRGRQWAFVIFSLMAILVICLAFLLKGIAKLKSSSPTRGIDSTGESNAPTDASALWRMGFGSVNVNFLLNLPGISSSGGLVRHVLLVNTPQLLLSLFYFAYNIIWTQMLLAREWAQFGKKRQGLRVSGQLYGSQRSSYFLTIPYKAALPLQVVSALLHWLLSQSFFLARVDVYSGTPFANFPTSIINTVGYSLIALVFLIVLWGLLLFAIVAAGCLGRLKSPMPLVGSNSLAISAACHPAPDDVDSATKPLMWGVIPRMEDGGVKHCSFSAGEVLSPCNFPLVEDRSGFKLTKDLFG